MAVTKGQGNPSWTKDETILALDLYLKCGEKIPSNTDKRVIALSALLRSMKIHPATDTNESFRNADGVAFKLQNLRQVATGKGLANFSAMYRAVWRGLGDKPDEVTKLADLIRQSVSILADEDPNIDDEEFAEGAMATRLHKRRERAKGLRPKLLKKKAAEGVLCCDVCGRQYSSLGSDLEDAPFEAHHVVPLAAAAARKTRLTDLALLCANCHRLIHRAMSRKRQWVSIDEARDLFGVKGRA